LTVDPIAKTGTCRHCGPVELVLRNYSSGPSLACKPGVVAREKATNTNPKYTPARYRAVAKYQHKKSRERLVQRTLKCLTELTMDELAQVLKAFPAIPNEEPPDDVDTLKPPPCSRCVADGFPSCECWLADLTTFGEGADKFEQAAQNG